MFSLQVDKDESSRESYANQYAKLLQIGEQTALFFPQRILLANLKRAFYNHE